jgi:hypothetical protein
MFYVSDGKVYVREGDHFRNVGFTAKDKVITRRELESTSVVMGTVVADTLTREEIITKFNLSEGNPIPVIKKSRKKSEEPAE